MAKDLNEKIAKGILSFMSGYAQAKSKGRELESSLQQDIFKERLKQQINPPGWKPRTMEEALAYKRAEAGIKPPIYKSVGKSLFSINPATNEATPIIKGPENTGKTLISPMVDKISKGEDAYYSLGDSVTQLESNKDTFSQFMGPGKGILRNPLRSYVNKDLQDFIAWQANVQDAFQQYRVAITGAQASDKEIKLLQKNRPTEADTTDVFVKKAKNVRRIGNKVISRYIGNLKKAGYDTTGYEETLSRLNSELTNLGSVEDEMASGDMAGTSRSMFKSPQGQRVKVKSPSGKIGTVPIGQLESALTQGYARI